MNITIKFTEKEKDIIESYLCAHGYPENYLFTETDFSFDLYESLGSQKSIINLQMIKF